VVRLKLDLSEPAHDWLIERAAERDATHGAAVGEIIEWLAGERARPPGIDVDGDGDGGGGASEADDEGAGAAGDDVRERLAAVEARVDALEADVRGPAARFGPALVDRIETFIAGRESDNSRHRTARVALFCAVWVYLREHRTATMPQLFDALYGEHAAGLTESSWRRAVQQARELPGVSGPGVGGSIYEFDPEAVDDDLLAAAPADLASVKGD
jgi:hypothetical protein